MSYEKSQTGKMEAQYGPMVLVYILVVNGLVTI